MNQVAIAERPMPTIQAGAPIRAIVPQSFDDAYRIAKAVTMAGMSPAGFETAEKAMIAIMHGMEVGLPPMQALQSIAVINGRPSIWGDGAMGLVRGSGLLEWAEEAIEGDGDAAVAVCRVQRRGEPKPIVRKFSVADAKAAGLWTKTGPWKQYPRRMLQMRARAFALRDGFADVLRGLSIAEEVQDVPLRDVTPPPAPAAALTPPPAPKIIEAQAVAAPPPPLHDPDTGEIADDDAPALLPEKESEALRIGLIKRMPNDSTASLEKWIKERATSIATLQPDDRQLIQDEWSARQADLFEREQREEHITDAG